MACMVCLVMMSDAHFTELATTSEMPCASWCAASRGFSSPDGGRGVECSDRAAGLQHFVATVPCRRRGSPHPARTCAGAGGRLQDRRDGLYWEEQRCACPH